MDKKEEKKSANELLQKKLFLEKKSSWPELNKEAVFSFAEHYSVLCVTAKQKDCVLPMSWKY